MPGGVRKTHDFPNGKPLPLTVLELTFAILFFVSAIAFGFNDWQRATPTVLIVIAYCAAYLWMIRLYEQTGRAIPRKQVKVIVSFPAGYPKPMLAARSAFFLVVALILTFGFGPFEFHLATKGIMACVLGLIGVAVVNLLLEQHYVNTGRGKETELTIKTGE